MTANTTPGQSVDQIREEEAAISQVIDRLRRKFPELTEEDVHRAVHGHYGVFKGAPIRDFGPVLVENIARKDLQARGPQRDAQSSTR
jgi:hypothetical protein